MKKLWTNRRSAFMQQQQKSYINKMSLIIFLVYKLYLTNLKTEVEQAIFVFSATKKKNIQL